MPRKSLLDLDPALYTAIEEFKSVSEIKEAMAQDVIAIQDEETKAAIDRIWGVLRTHARDTINVKVGKTYVPVPISAEYLTMNLRWLAVEIVKDLAILGTRVANFEFPPNTCASCGGET